ncbi:MAG TPA: ATP-binding protein [Acidimicrobiales bacterium]|nr:ATP-binding protein [Acidimicrobiales bacterium]
MNTAEVLLRGEPRDAMTARHFVRDTLSGWGATDHEDSAVLLVSELVANASLHAKTEVSVCLRRGPGKLRIEVGDRSSRSPMIRKYGPQATTGRGLALVIALAQRWGVQTVGTGKAVWVELDDDAHMVDAPGSA